MGNRRSSAPSPSGPQWVAIIVALGGLLAGVGAVLGPVLQAIGPGATPSQGGPVAAETTPRPTASSLAATASADALLVGSIDMVPGALVRIEATGNFAKPPVGGLENIGQGSGFIVDSSGTIVTNSHVVTGAETVTVWVGSELTKQTADVLGKSECSDLAVLRLKGRQDLPYLGWYKEGIDQGLSVQAAGYPLGATKPVVTAGKVSSARGVTNEPRLSVDDTIELDIDISVGSSGGPVVTNDGRVVGISYPREDEKKQPFAISWREARPILDRLQGGRDVTFVGINGYAQKSDPAGIWVAAVQPQSLAANAGILPGDVITHLDGKPIAVDGTMADYCDVLGDDKRPDPLPFTVYRGGSRETLEGEFNGDRVKPAFAFVAAVGSAETGPPPAWKRRSTESRGTLSVEASPLWKEWKDHAWKFDGAWAGPGILISSDLAGFHDGYREPGAFIAASATLSKTTTLMEVLDAPRSGLKGDGCKLASEATPFARGGYAGIYDLWESCGRGTSRFLTIAAEKAGSHIIYIQFQAPEAADLEILDRMLVTLKFDP